MSQHDDLKGAYFYETTGLFEIFGPGRPDGSGLRLRRWCIVVQPRQFSRLCPPDGVQRRRTFQPAGFQQPGGGEPCAGGLFSATGNTAAAAETIAAATGGELFPLESVTPYTDADLDYNDSGSRTSRERADASLQNVPLVSTAVEGWDTYDTVFVGYPIWWGDAGWPVNGFVSGNDFTGKRVIPFCTSASSGLGQSGARLAGLAGTGDWKEGRRFSSSAGEEEISEWLTELGLA